jgi:hypothetical protein
MDFLPKKPEDKFANKIVEENKKMIAELFPKDESGNSILHDKEVTKIILDDIHKKEHIPSLTNLTRKEIDAVRLAFGMNMVAKNPLITNDIAFFLDLKRSETAEPTNMLKGLFDVATQYIQQTGNQLMRKMGLH